MEGGESHGARGPHALPASGQTLRRGGGVALGQAPPTPSRPHRKTELRDSVSWSEPATSAVVWGARLSSNGLGHMTELLSLK